MLLSELKKGESANVLAIKGTGALRHHLLDMGLTPGTEVTLQKIAPMGDPVQMKVRGYELTLRLSEAQKIDVDHVHEKEAEAVEIEKIGKQPNAAPAVAHASVAHPRIGELGEAGDYCIQKIGKEIPKGQPITFALAGNQNCGKTTLFNQLTGARQHVGNFPGTYGVADNRRIFTKINLRRCFPLQRHMQGMVNQFANALIFDGRNRHDRNP